MFNIKHNVGQKTSYTDTFVARLARIISRVCFCCKASQRTVFQIWWCFYKENNKDDYMKSWPDQSFSCIILNLFPPFPSCLFCRMSLFVIGVPVDIIIPSLPGYGYSSAPKKPGMSVPQIAIIMSKLMTRLGYSQYIVQGGDWGSMIATTMAALDPQCVALHINFFPVNKCTFFYHLTFFSFSSIFLLCMRVSFHFL